MKTSRAVYPLLLVLLIDSMGVGLIFPVLAPIFVNPDTSLFGLETSRHMRDFYYGLTMSVFFICTFFAAPLLGDLSDQMGRKKVLMLSLAIIAGSYLISALGIVFKSLFLLILGRATAGFAAGSQGIAQAAIIDVSEGSNKTSNLALITLASCIGFVIGPIVGGYFSDFLLSGWYGYTLPFFVATLLATANAVYLYFGFKETYSPKVHAAPQIFKVFKTIKLAFANIALCKVSLIFLLMQLGWGIYFQFVSLFLAHDYNYGPSQIGYFMAYLGLIFAISLTVIIRVLLRFIKLKTVSLASLCLLAAGLFVTAFFDGELAHWISAAPIAVGVALNYAALLTMFSNRADPKSQGMIMGITGSILAIAWFIDGLLMGVLTSWGNQFPFIIAGCLIILAIIVLSTDKS